MNLPKPQILRCFSERTFDPPLPAMELRWHLDHASAVERTWHLPDGVVVKGATPSRFGVTIHRDAENSYQVRVLWNRLSLTWQGLTRNQVMASSLAPLLHALGTDLWYLLNQPIDQPLAA
jgi:hypothetical protein